ncbi:MAG: acyl-CoA dehydratase activase [Desulfobacterales bacterium]|nr:acyl-CoA dehydratase activase [Desulfobacterales bacterium]
MKAGFDFGAKNIAYAVLDKDRAVLKDSLPHNGDITGTYNTILSIIGQSGYEIRNFGVTGSIELDGLTPIDPVIASVEASRLLDTRCRNILSIGCESFYMIRLDDAFNYVEHFVNSDCASGTGSFIDQQAERLGFTTETLAEQAYIFDGTSPSIATRCAVFAKSDIIHAQAQGFSKEAISAGLCEGVTRSVLANTVKGREVNGSILFIGGMSRNRKIVGEIGRMLDRKVMIHDDGLYFNAMGAAALGDLSWEGRRNLMTTIRKEREVRPPLEISLAHYPDFNEDHSHEADGIEITIYEEPDAATVDVYIGIDVGSTSTKAVVTDTKGRILAGLYGRTKGDPVQAVTALLARVREIFSGREVIIRGVATTGSGRELIREVVGADMAINEITAHAKGATFLDPEVDTIIEIGGQDSKFTLLKDGVVTNAVMNYVCAAGTGSFIEEQAKRLDFTLPDISNAVPGKTAPFTSDRCTVYMERDLNIFLSEGWEREQIMAAVLYSVRDNYLSKVVGKSVPGKKIYFQGATARNKALVAVFENELGQEVFVSKYCHLTGALGCTVALMEADLRETTFTGMDFTCDVSSEICTLCSNQCDLRIYTTKGRKTAWGLKCGRDYNDKKAGRQTRSSRFERSFHETFTTPTARPENAESTGTIGIPEALFMKEYTPMFKDFFQQLGFTVIVEKSTSSKLTAGMNMINADFCAPMALAHGLVESLARKGVDHIFLPTLINEQAIPASLEREESFREKSTDAYFCYYSSYAATIIDNLAGQDFGGKLLLPKIKFNNTPVETVASRLAEDLTGPFGISNLDIEKAKIEAAFIKARNTYLDQRKRWAQAGNEIIHADKKKIKILLLGRPYALFDKRVNLGIPARLEQMGFELMNQSMLDVDALNLDTLNGSDGRPDHLENMHWYFGQQILLAAEAVRQHPDMYPVFLTCFRCSPDAYLINYFKDFMEKIGKPYLILQLDEHSSDVGYMTRIEAAVDTFVDDFKQRKDQAEPAPIKRKSYTPDTLTPGDTVLIPMTDQRINALQQAVFQVTGFDARVVPLDREMLNLGYRYATGGECLPNVAIAGSLIATLQREEIDPAKAVLYLPSLCLSCNFNQYANLVKLACGKAGMDQVRVMNVNGLQALPGIPARSNALLLSVTILSSILNKLRYRFAPYETEPGATARAVAESEEIIRQHILDKKSLLTAAEKVRKIFTVLPLPAERKPRIGILGDMYAKYNTVLNDAIADHAERLGGEILLPSYNELVLHTMHADVVENDEDKRLMAAMAGYEQRFENIFRGLLDDAFEPDLEECRDLMNEFGLTNFIAGETYVSLGRMLYYIRHKLVDAVIHVNPVFCCPGVISSSIFRKIQERYNIPVIDLFYDGTNKPNRMIDPHMFYLNRKKTGAVN